CHKGKARLARGGPRRTSAALRRALDDRGGARNRRRARRAQRQRQRQRQRRNGGGLRVGLADGRVLPVSSAVRRGIRLHDVVFVKETEARGKQAARLELRVRPVVQGAAIILDNKSGGILAMAGGFSYPLSQL